jgi:hypothetical protein
MNATVMEGKCLCGAVSIHTRPHAAVEACHCGMCRQWGGGPYLSIHCGADTRISGKNHITEYASSEWATRGFCKTCGTHLYYRLKASEDYEIPAGLFRQQDELQLTKQIFIDRKPPYYDFANVTEMLTEEQVFAQYAPQ